MLRTRVWLSFGLLLCVMLQLNSCAGLQKAKRLQDEISAGEIAIRLDRKLTNSVSLTYTGCSGFFMRYGDEVLIHDPFFSTTGPLASLMFKPLQTDEKRIDTFFQQYFTAPGDTAGLTKFLLVAHSHHDHLADVPYIYNNLLNRDSTIVLSNGYAKNLMNTQAAPEDRQFADQIRSVEAHLAHANYEGRFVYTSSRRIRVLPICSTHGGHFYGISLAKGRQRHRPPKKALQYKEGATMAFLIDFLDDDENVALRVYINSAASKVGEGQVPEQILENHPVDIAILCAASFAYTKSYPETILSYLKPTHLLVSHWENFFQSQEKLLQRNYVVPFTSIKRFLRKVERAQAGLDYTIPALETTIQVQF